MAKTLLELLYYCDSKLFVLDELLKSSFTTIPVIVYRIFKFNYKLMTDC